MGQKGPLKEDCSLSEASEFIIREALADDEKTLFVLCQGAITNLMKYNFSEGAQWTQGESWSLGDSPAIALALNPGCGRYEVVSAPYIEDDASSKECPENAKIRVYKDVDSRYILEDLIAKLELFAGS